MTEAQQKAIEDAKKILKSAFDHILISAIHKDEFGNTYIETGWVSDMYNMSLMADISKRRVDKIIDHHIEGELTEDDTD